MKTFGRNLNIKLSENTFEKVDVKKFSETGAYFDDGSYEDFSVVIYATGYDFQFPFLSVDCGISAVGKHVFPLYKHCVNINRPSMMIVGLPFFAVGFPLFDLQLRFILKIWSGGKNLPTKEEMLKETLQDEEERRSKGLKSKKMHFLGPERHAKYYSDLAEAAEIEPLKPVIAKIFDKTVENLFKNFNTYRFKDFKLVDGENFEEILLDEN